MSSNNTFGENVLLNISLPSNATGIVNISIGGVPVGSHVLVNGFKTITLSGLNAGHHVVEVTYSGDGKYASATGSKSFDMAQAPSSVVIGDVYVSGASVTIPYVIINKTDVVISLVNKNKPGASYSYTLVGGLVYATNLDDGNYTITISNIAEGNYNASSDSKDFVVSNIVPVVEIIAPDSVVFGEDVVLNVTLPVGATGTVSISVDGIKVGDYALVNGSASVILSGLDIGSHIIEAKYNGNDKYTSVSNYTSFIVEKIVPSIEIVVPSDIVVGDNVTVIINVPDVEGKVIVIFDSIEHIVDLVNGSGEFTINNIASGNHLISVIYEGDDTHVGRYALNSLNVTKLSSSIEVYANNTVFEGENTIIGVVVSEGATGIVLVNVGNLQFVLNITEADKFNVVLPVGNYAVVAKYLGDDKFKQSVSNSINITVLNKLASFIEISVSDIEFGSDAIVNITLPAGATGVICVKVDNVFMGNFNLTDSKSSIVLSNLSVGSHIIEVDYDGDGNYASSMNYTSFNVGKIQPSINIDVPSGAVFGDDIVLNITLPAGATGIVDISIGGTFIGSSALVNSSTNITLSGLNAGHHVVEVIYRGDDKYASSSASNSFDISPATSSVIIDDIEVVGTTVFIPYTVVNQTDVVISLVNKNKPGVSYSYTLAGSIIYAADLDDGNYTITISNIAEGNYNASSDSKDFVVSNIVPVVEIIAPDSVVFGEDVVLNVTLPVGATGTVSISVDGIKVGDYALVNGRVDVVLSNLDVGSHIIEAIYNGDNKYASASNYTTVIVEKIVPSIEIVVPSDIVVGDNVTIKVNVLDVEGKVIIIFDFVEHVVDLIDGVGQFTINNISGGNHYIGAIYEGDDTHVGKYNTTDLNVTKIPSSINITTNGDVLAGENSIITVDVSLGATGMVLIDIGDVQYSLNLTKTDTLTVVLPVGEYSVVAKYLGDDKFKSSISNLANIKVIGKLAPSIDIAVEDIKYGEQAIVNITLPGDATGFITLNIDGKGPVTYNLVDGKVSIPISGLTVGSHMLEVTYSGDDKYGSSVSSKSLIVSKIDANLEVSVDSVEAGENAVVHISVPGATGNVTVIVDDNPFVVSLNDNGTAIFEIKNVIARDYLINVIYDGDETHRGDSASVEFSVNPKPSSIVISSNSTVNFGEKTTIKVNVTSGATGFVVFDIAGTQYLLNISKSDEISIYLPVGEHEITATYTGDEIFDSSVSNKITVNVLGKFVPSINIAVDDIKCGNDAIVNITLPLDATGAVSIVIDNNVIGEYTIVDGFVKIPISGLTVGSHTIEVSYDGDDKYESTYSSKTFNVLKIDTFIDAPSKFTCTATDFYAGEKGDKFYVTLRDENGNVIANKKVQITIAGRTYDRTTDANGVTWLQINLVSANTYTCYVNFKGDDVYNQSPDVSFDVVVVKKVTSISASAVSFKLSKKTKTVSVKLTTSKNNDGNIYLNANKKLTLKVNGKTYTAKTDENGIAKFNVVLSKKGTYTANINFAGDNTYKASSKSIKITIK